MKFARVSRPVDDGRDRGPLRVRDVAPVHGHGEAVVLDGGAGDVGEAPAQRVARRGEHGDDLRGHGVAEAAGPVDVEAVAPRVVELLEPDELADLLARAAADDGHRRLGREALDRVAHGFRERRGGGVLDDGRERAVVVEEDDELAPRTRRAAGEGRGDVERARQRAPVGRLLRL